MDANMVKKNLIQQFETAFDPNDTWYGIPRNMWESTFLSDNGFFAQYDIMDLLSHLDPDYRKKIAIDCYTDLFEAMFSDQTEYEDIYEDEKDRALIDIMNEIQ